MRVALEPVNRPRIDALVLDGDPEYCEQVPGGLTTATVRAALPLGEAPAMKDARIAIAPVYGREWVGTVDSAATDDAGITTLECVGAQEPLQRVKPRRAVYCDTSVDWSERTIVSRSQDLACSVEAATLRIAIENGTVIPAGKGNGFWRRVPRCSSAKHTLSWARGSLGTRLRLIAGLYSPDDVTGSEMSPTTPAIWTQDAGSGAYSGAEEITINVDHNCLLLVADCPSQYTAGTDFTLARFFNLKYYGVAEALTIPMTVGAVIKDVASRIPAWVGSSSTSFIADDSSTAEPFVLDDVRTTEQDVLSSALGLTTRDGGLWPRLIGGKPTNVLIYGDRKTTPSYHAYVDGTVVVASYGEDSTEDTPSGVLGIYQHADGSTDTVEATPAVPNFSTISGRARWKTIDVPTTSVYTATAVAQSMADSPAPVKGSLRVEGPIVNAIGGTVYPSEIYAGEVMRVHDPVRGVMDLRIVGVRKLGDTSCSVEFDNTQTRIEAWLARLERGAVQSSRWANRVQRAARRFWR